MPENVEPFDLLRMFVGEHPPLFYLEILFRTLVIYVYALLLLRFVGQRALGQVSLIEFFLVIALGSAVGDAMFYPEVPLLHAMLVITLVVGIDVLLDVVIDRSRAAEKFMEGVTKVCVEQGVVRRKDAPLGLEELFQKLRSEGIRNLGQVEAAYLEPGGQLSVFEFEQERPGLPLVPPPSVVPYETVADLAGEHDGEWACVACGLVRGAAAAGSDVHCDECRGVVWTRACRGCRVIVAEAK